ncbi:hypothetical protein ACHAXS_012046 [Conticribra weissflogii]
MIPTSMLLRIAGGFGRWFAIRWRKIILCVMIANSEVCPTPMRNFEEKLFTSWLLQNENLACALFVGNIIKRFEVSIVIIHRNGTCRCRQQRSSDQAPRQRCPTVNYITTTSTIRPRWRY